MIVRTVIVEPFGENAYVLGCEDTGQGVLVDPGGRVEDLIALAEASGIEIGGIWLTHAHLDHVTGVAEAVAVTGAEVWLHPEDRPLYDAVPRQGEMFGIEVTQPPDPDRELRGGETLELGDLKAEVLHVPGHSPGHVAFWFRDQRIVASGDCLFAGSIGRTDLPGGSYETLMDSLHRVLLPLGDEARVLPGHGPETTIGRERRSNPFLSGLSVV